MSEKKKPEKIANPLRITKDKILGLINRGYVLSKNSKGYVPAANGGAGNLLTVALSVPQRAVVQLFIDYPELKVIYDEVHGYKKPLTYKFTGIELVDEGVKQVKEPVKQVKEPVEKPLSSKAGAKRQVAESIIVDGPVSPPPYPRPVPPASAPPTEQAKSTNADWTRLFKVEDAINEDEFDDASEVDELVKEEELEEFEEEEEVEDGFEDDNDDLLQDIN